MNMEENALVKYTFLKLLLKEFDIHIKETEEDKIALAKQCVEIYDTPEEFYEKTNWDRDNPEQSSIKPKAAIVFFMNSYLMLKCVWCRIQISTPSVWLKSEDITKQKRANILLLCFSYVL